MKQVLSLLVIFTFLNVQLWAYAPNYGTTGNNASGTYAGVFIPTGATATTKTSAALGIFSVAIQPASGSTPFVQGVGVLFIAGAGYNLTISGIYDPGSNSLQAVVDGVSTFTVTFTSGTTSTTGNLFAEGSMSASLASANSRSALTGPDTAGAERLNGTASLDLFEFIGATGPTISSTATFAISGFQQSSVAAVPSLSSTTLGGG